MAIEEETRTIKVYVCDVCGKRSDMRMRRCLFCGKHICNECIGKNKMMVLEVKRGISLAFTTLSYLSSKLEVVVCKECEKKEKEFVKRLMAEE